VLVSRCCQQAATRPLKLFSFFCLFILLPCAPAEAEKQPAPPENAAAAPSTVEQGKTWDPFIDEGKEPINMTPGKPRQRGPKFTEEYIEKVNLKAEGVGFGYETGYWNPTVLVGLRVVVPVNDRKNFNLKFRLFMPMGPFNHDFDPVIIAEVGVLIRTPVYMGLVRLFMGGGVFVGYRPITYSNDNKSKCHLHDSCRIGVSGGGGAGVEVFFSERRIRAFFLEIGGQGPTHPLRYDSGAHVIAGATWYFGE
jgi:hypothetical protein